MDKHVRRRRWGIVAILLLCAAGCDATEAPVTDRGSRRASAPPPAAPAPRPYSIVLVVLDTVRADAVSAYGRTPGVTPVIDAVAQEGLLYRRAYANASWTLPSHASLFTGLWPNRHGVGWLGTHLPDEFETIAERLAAAGYETVGISENPWVSPSFNMTQGFERFSSTVRSSNATLRAVETWLAARDADRPFFLFVNLTEAHRRYRARDGGSFLPADVSVAAAMALPQRVAEYLCRWSPESPSAAALKGLYLEGVHAADRKLARILSRLRRATRDDPTVVVITSDHGEYFGEDGMAEHVVGVGTPVIQVPLIVQGAPGAPRGTIGAPVQLVDLAPSVLVWAGLPVPPGLSGRPLPVSDATAPDRAPIVAEWYDPADHVNEQESEVARASRQVTSAARAHCGPDQRVFGTMRTLIMGSDALRQYDRFPSELFDLVADPTQRRDLAAERKSTAAGLSAELERLIVMSPRRGHTGSVRPEIDADAARRLRQLGYLE